LKVGVQEVVHIVAELIADGEAQMAQRHGPQAVSAAEGARSLLAERLRQDLSEDALWEDFESDPRGTSAQLAGTLEALVEADPSLAQELDAFMQEFYRAVGSSGVRASEPAPASELFEDRELSEAEQAGQALEQGAYLYGNVEAGAVTVGERVGAAESVPAADRRAAGVPLEPSGSTPPFEDLHAAINAYPGIEPVDKEALQNALRGVLSQAVRGIEASEERLLYHLLTIRRLNADVLEIVLTGLAEGEDLPRALRQAMMKAREMSI
jgi:hypothetical protein